MKRVTATLTGVFALAIIVAVVFSQFRSCSLLSTEGSAAWSIDTLLSKYHRHERGIRDLVDLVRSANPKELDGKVKELPVSSVVVDWRRVGGLVVVGMNDHGQILERSQQGYIFGPDADVMKEFAGIAREGCLVFIKPGFWIYR